MLWPLLVLSLVLFYFSWRLQFIPVSLANSAVWLALGTYLFIYMAPPLDITQMDSQFLMAGLFLMAFVPLLLQMRVDIQSEKRARKIVGRGGLFGEEAQTMTKYQYSWQGQKQLTAGDRQTAHREEVRRRINRR